MFTVPEKPNYSDMQFMQGSSNTFDYLIVHFSGGIGLGVKPLLGVLNDSPIVAIRVRAAPYVPVSKGKGNVAELSTGVNLISAYPDLPFTKESKDRKSFVLPFADLSEDTPIADVFDLCKALQVDGGVEKVLKTVHQVMPFIEEKDMLDLESFLTYQWYSALVPIAQNNEKAKGAVVVPGVSKGQVVAFPTKTGD